MNGPVRVLASDLKFPDNLRIWILCYLHDPSTVVFQVERGRRADEHVVVWKLLNGTSPKRVREGIGPENPGGHVGFVDLVNDGTAVAGRRAIQAANSSVRIEH